MAGDKKDDNFLTQKEKFRERHAKQRTENHKKSFPGTVSQPIVPQQPEVDALIHLQFTASRLFSMADVVCSFIRLSAYPPIRLFAYSPIPKLGRGAEKKIAVTQVRATFQVEIIR
jgi:hypothetical protein